MKKADAKRIYISDANPSCYENVKGFIDTCLTEHCSEDEVIVLCFRESEHNIIAKQYAAEKGLKVEYFHELTDKRRLAEKCDLLLLFRGEENSEINELMSYALTHKIPFFVENIA